MDLSRIRIRRSALILSFDIAPSSSNVDSLWLTELLFYGRELWHDLCYIFSQGQIKMKAVYKVGFGRNREIGVRIGILLAGAILLIQIGGVSQSPQGAQASIKPLV